MSELQQVANMLSTANPPINLHQVFRFLAFASRLKNEILLVQPGAFQVDRVLPVLSPSIQEFLAEASGVAVQWINLVWHTVGQTAWNLQLNCMIPTPSISAIRSLFSGHGYSRGISKKSSTTTKPYSLDAHL
ncbi:hypothetical protein CVT26_009293 [Gymnopilus dilepis]|uniref:Uncharacterized protein n=1 Tax=Gymnopilus dilepis TaxID=231916 RepID=A0A409YAJ1_9AGAR|nr:hypothetical protein CVT26_009293 [Gymnopilus dilepis]